MKRIIACIDSSPCMMAVAESAAWIAQKTQRELVLLQILDYYPASYHLGEISGVIGFESNAMLLKELAQLEQKQGALALEYSNNLLKHISEFIEKKYDISPKKIQEKGDFLEQAFLLLKEDDLAILGRVGEDAARKKKLFGSHVESFIRGAKCNILTVGTTFKPPTRFIFAYENSDLCNQMMYRITQSDVLRLLQCHLIHVGDDPEVLTQPTQFLTQAGLDVVSIFRCGDVAKNITLYQQEQGIQLLVMGAFSRSKIQQFFLGSITTSIFRNVEVPLFVVKH